MKCPKCNVTLLMSEKQNVEIDYCPECRGIWLDRGELEKIIERTYAGQQSEREAYSYNKRERYEDDDNYKKEHYQKHDSGFFGQHKDKRKRSFLEDIFDF